ncbi:MAG: 6,7-dimethyl-8-ribityllumazine synthase [Saprospiraceae bacterium]|nr:6,7-dimethyl-8-ribityllumazine synthase [Saprospiraceae bacterium]
MASAKKNLSTYDEASIPSGEGFSVGIVVSDWNAEITHALYEGCFDTLTKHGVKEDKIYTEQVPGTFELPTAAKIVLAHHHPDVVICIGCVIKGETKHDEYINNAVSTALANLGMVSGKPVIFGVLTPNTEEQAKDRAGGKHGNKGVEAAVTALRMAALKKKLSSAKKTIGF